MKKTEYEIEWLNDNTWVQNSTWVDITLAPKNGSEIYLLIPFNKKTFSEKDCTIKGYWDEEAILYSLSESEKSAVILERGCWRYTIDKGAFDVQPLFWKINE